MLPPDTSCLVLWRVMVPLLQIMGCFPYKMSKTGPPAFSLLLCLWAVFIQLFVSSSFTLCAVYIGKYHLTAEFGITAFFYGCVFMITIMSFLPLLLGLKSPALAAILHDLFELQGVTPPPTHRWYCRPQFLLFLSPIIFSSLFMTCYVTIFWEFRQFLEIILIFVSGLLFNTFIVLPTHLCSMVFHLISHRLVYATEKAVAEVCMLLALSGSAKPTRGVAAAMQVLSDLDAVIREVEIQREKGARYFFEVVTLYLLIGVMMTIVCPYAILKGTTVGGITVIVLLTQCASVLSFCHVGQAFINKVTVAEDLLKDLRVKSRSHLLTTKVNQVIGSISPMLTFNMCGWYRLDYAAFLGLTNTVLTYVVILFQVGGNDLDSLLASSQGTNSSTFH